MFTSLKNMENGICFEISLELYAINLKQHRNQFVFVTALDKKNTNLIHVLAIYRHYFS